MHPTTIAACRVRTARSALSMAIIPQSKANVLATSNAVKERLAEIQPTLPEDIKVDINMDNGVYIAASLKNVVFALSETLVLVLDRDLPVPGDGARHADSGGHHPGLHRRRGHRHGGARTIRSTRSRCWARCSPSASSSTTPSWCSRTSCGESKAANRRCWLRSTASKEIGFAVIATTLVLMAVFVPVSFMTGDTGRTVRRVRRDRGGRGRLLGVHRAVAHADDGLQAVRERHAQVAMAGGIDRVFHNLDDRYAAGLRGALVGPQTAVDRRRLARPCSACW